MAARYTGPMRFIFKGDSGVAQRYTGLARKYMGMAIQRMGDGKANWTRIEPDGTRIRVYDYSGTKTAEITTILPSVAVCTKGLYFLPTSDDAPNGWGPPEYPNDIGVPGELPAGVIIDTEVNKGKASNTTSAQFVLDWTDGTRYLTWEATYGITDFDTESREYNIFHRYMCKPNGTKLYLCNKELGTVPEGKVCGAAFSGRTLYVIVYGESGGLWFKLYTANITEAGRAINWELHGPTLHPGASGGYLGTEVTVASGAYFNRDCTRSVVTLRNTTNEPIGYVEIQWDGVAPSLSENLDYKDTETYIHSRESTYGPYYTKEVSETDHSDDYSCTSGGGITWDRTLDLTDTTAEWQTSNPSGTSEFESRVESISINNATILGADFKNNQLVTITRSTGNVFSTLQQISRSASGGTKQTAELYDCSTWESSPGIWQTLFVTSARTYGKRSYILGNDTSNSFNVSYIINGETFPLRYQTSEAYTRDEDIRVYDTFTYQVWVDTNFVWDGGDPPEWNDNTTVTRTVSSATVTDNARQLLYVDLRYDIKLYAELVAAYDSDGNFTSSVVQLKVNDDLIAQIPGAAILPNLEIGDLCDNVSFTDGVRQGTVSYGLQTVDDALAIMHNLSGVAVDRFGNLCFELPEYTYNSDTFSIDKENTHTLYYSPYKTTVFTDLGYTGDNARLQDIKLI